MRNGQAYLKGFTLLELIVAMAIIAVLVGLSVIGITTVQRSSRDTERLAGLEGVNLEVESYYGNNGSYPTVVFSDTLDTITVGTRTITMTGAAKVNTTPTGGAGTTTTETDYCYSGAGTSSYSLGARLESAATPKYFGSATGCTL